MTEQQNEQQNNPSEKVASVIMRALAIIGLVAVLALAAWTVIQGIKLIPQADDGLTAAVSAISGVFSNAPSEAISFSLTERTVISGEEVTLSWDYVGDVVAPEFMFSYECEDGVAIETMNNGIWQKLSCGEGFAVAANTLRVLPTAEQRFVEIEITVSVGELADTTLIAIENASGISTTSALDQAAGIVTTTTEDDSDEEVTEVTDTTNSVAPIAPYTPPTPRPVVARDPADLVLNIEETGVLVEVSGENEFFPVSPIPSDKVAGVTFTVANRGDVTSSAWAFVATLPVQGDEEYRYVSPAQAGLKPGMQILFTLGFDEILEDDRGTITIKLVPSDSTDRTENNTDAVRIDIREE